MDNWENLRKTKEGIQQLADLFKNIIPANKRREDFLRVFTTLQGANPLATKPVLSKAQGVAFNMYGLIRMELKHRERVDIATKTGNQNALEKLEGMTFGDRITDYAKGVMNMLIGPGQSIANRAAGAALLIAAFKLAQKAYRGDGKTGKALRVAFMAVAAELALKQVTGEGLTDKMRLTGLSDALEGTYESVLMNRMENAGVGMTKTEHAATLIEIRNQPMDKLIDWYEATDDGGNALTAKDPQARFPRGLDVDNMVRGSATKNKDARARFLLKQTMKNFFGYVGNKNGANKGPDVGKAIIKERWLSAADNKNYDPNKFENARYGLSAALADQIRGNPRLLNWQMVMQNEIEPADVDNVSKNRNTAKLRDFFKTQAYSIYKWTHDDLVNRVGVGAKEFWENVSTDYAPQLQNWLMKMSKAGATKLKYMGRSVELWYQGNKLTLQKAWNDTWELAWEGVKLPFTLLHEGHQLLVPLALTKLQQMKALMRSNKVDVLRPGEQLTAQHIMPDNVFNALNSTDANGRANGQINGQPFGPMQLSNRKLNPKYSYLGRFQIPFRHAIGQRTGFPREHITQPARPGSSPARMIEGMRPHISYMITRMTPQEAGVTDPTLSPADQYNKMWARSHEQAKRFYLDKGIPVEMIDKFMFPVHVKMQNSNETQKTPQTLYMFWRMPLKQSREYQLKAINKWTDYKNPNKHKFRPTFITDPKKGWFDNFSTAFGLRNPALQTGLGYAGVVPGQWARLMLATLESAGGMVHSVGERFFRLTPQQIEWIKQITKQSDHVLQRLDEVSGNAMSPRTASSEFYKDVNNSRIFARAKAYADKNRKPIDLVNEHLSDGTLRPWNWTSKRVNTETRYKQGNTYRYRVETYDAPGSVRPPTISWSNNSN